MSSNSGLTAPGSSTYDSNTLHVGDGTWDTGRDTFLLPNLMGLNFATMRYNGMGNRFRDMNGYRSMIIAHGVIATIVFLGLVPMSILIIRYYSRWNSYWAFKLHAWFQVMTLLLTTVVFVLGWFAVGPERSLTNPHHGIGLAIYVMVIFQVFWGWLVHKIESKRKRYHVPMKLIIHRWLGRALALLGLIQIPLGLTLYGSPKSLFILYSLGAFAYLVALFILSYLYDEEGYYMGSEFDSRVSGPSGPTGEPHRHHFGRMAAAGATGLGLAEFFRRRRSRSKDRYDDSHTSYTDEKYTDDESHHGGWRKRLLQLGALAGVFALAKKFFDRRRNRESDMESGRYRPAHTRSDSMTEESFSRLEDGRRPEPSYQGQFNRPPSRQPSRPPSRTQSPGSSYYYNSAYFTEDDPGPSHKVRNAFLGAGALAAVKKLFSRRKDDEEQRRVDEMRRRDREDERLARANSKRRYTGGGHNTPYRRAASYTATDMSSTDVTRPPRGPSYGESGLTGEPMASGAVEGTHSDMPPAPPIHLDPASEMTGAHTHGHNTAELGGSALAGSYATQRPHSSGRPGEEHVDSPPVSVKVKMHNDGRHVTLRRLTEEEAAANRRRERRASRRRAGSASSLSGNEGSYDRWRRVEELERQQAEQIQREREAAAAAAAANNSIAQSGSLHPSSFMPPPHSHMPPPPPIPHAPSSLPYGAGSITSPGTFTGTDASGDYANNRRRRRAERARARQERQGHGVEFT